MAGLDEPLEDDWSKEFRCMEAFIGSLLDEFKEIFKTEGPSTTLTEHRIDTGDSPPVSVPPYRVLRSKREILKKEIDEMLRLGVIEESESAWTSNVVLVTKKNGGTRVCIDFREVNKVSDRYLTGIQCPA